VEALSADSLVASLLVPVLLVVSSTIKGLFLGGHVCGLGIELSQLINRIRTVLSAMLLASLFPVGDISTSGGVLACLEALLAIASSKVHLFSLDFLLLREVHFILDLLFTFSLSEEPAFALGLAGSSDGASDSCTVLETCVPSADFVQGLFCLELLLCKGTCKEC